MDEIKRVCLVDDDEDVREVFSMFIEENYPEIEIQECNNGYEALEIIQNGKLDLLISDLKMPDMDGNELVYRLDQYPATKPDHVLILTGFLADISDETTKQKNISYLTKPFKQNVFKAYIRKNLGLIDKETLDKKRQDEALAELEQNKEVGSKGGLDFIEPFIDVTISFIHKISQTKVRKGPVYIRTEATSAGQTRRTA